MTDTPRHIVFRLPPQIALTPVNFTVQVVALIFCELESTLPVTQLRFQQMTSAVIKVFNPLPVPEL
ncbi:hypothetical protein QJI92_000240 [Salmonella enterica]|nr:hypothetical protein [Salmonella enterica]